MSDVDVRLITEAEFTDWIRANQIGFLDAPSATPEDAALRLKWTDLGRVRGGYDRATGRCVATFRSFAQEVSVPGGGRVASSAISNVSVLSTHRRRGLLSRMMADELAAARERGDVVSTLIAAEHPIYGRFGYGPATSLVEWEVDVRRAGFDRRRSTPECGGRIDVVDAAQVREFGPGLLDRLAARTAGVVSRGWWNWNMATGLDRPSFRPYTGQIFAAYRSPEGRTDGYVAYRSDDRWSDAKVPVNTLTVTELLAVTPQAERALWQFVCTTDYVTTVRTGYRAPDDLLPDLLPDPRAAHTVTAADQLWIRLLDVPAALSARTYEAPGTLVLEVTDATGPAAGRYRLDAAAGECVRVDEAVPADLRLDAGVLGSLYLGGGSAVRLAALGRVAELRSGAVARAELVFRTARSPWCPDVF
ncbi:GNAT family N-acetyltransferase [Streptomyces sp. WAC06614]|uniref:GNAT family N-acetyltransferase n=1 Tax=Streptomyces sp. WAC06614 TaxID=2487416 RepID=UPI000F76D0CE|nr:GNAT family N-acetyltransferase [Streptomyces sp. WAC06614]RSS81977.1 GNAT family N-acetyltransferase [Streptomyces sp. WAC06614]